MRLSELLKEKAFPNEPLDEKDRKIIETAYNHGHEGVGFNKFVKELNSSVSRSTVASRTEKLCKLGYLERVRSNFPGDVKPVRVSFKCFSVLSFVEKMRNKTAEVVQKIKDESAKQEEAKLDSTRNWYGSSSELRMLLVKSLLGFSLLARSETF